MVIDDDDVRLRRLASSLEEEALVEDLALEALTDIGLRRDLVPNLWARRRRQITQRSIGGARGPGVDGGELALHPVLEERRTRSPRLLESQKTEIIPPSLQQRELHALVAQRRRQKGQILSNELLLKIDGVRGDDGAITI